MVYGRRKGRVGIIYLRSMLPRWGNITLIDFLVRWSTSLLHTFILVITHLSHWYAPERKCCSFGSLNKPYDMFYDIDVIKINYITGSSGYRIIKLLLLNAFLVFIFILWRVYKITFSVVLMYNEILKNLLINWIFNLTNILCTYINRARNSFVLHLNILITFNDLSLI